MKSHKLVKQLNEIVLPYKVTFPYTVEGSVNSTYFKFLAKEESEITDFAVYENLMHSSYAKYIDSDQN